ncbi:MAG: BRO family protein [Verrucomicrobiota bacterium]
MNPITLTHPELNASVRIIERDDQPWFVAKDVCDVLGILQTGPAIEKLDTDEVTQIHLTDALGREQKTYIISESGLYALILRSDKAAARTFRKWVTSEVLPSLRKDGFYASRLEPGERELLVLEYRIKAAKLREESRYWDHKAAAVNLLPGAIPLYDWVVEQFPDLGHRQQANMTRQVKRDLLDLGLPVGIARGARKQLTALPADLAKLTPRAPRN